MEKQRPKVSIGLPVYNGAQYIGRTLDSLQAQTFRDYEIIVCDNASTDHTLDIVQAYAANDPRIKVHKNTQNRGAVYNYNRTLKLATGEFFKWIAADDVIQTEFLFSCINVLEANPSVVLAYTKAAFIDENDRVLYEFDDIVSLKPWSNQPVKRAGQMIQSVTRNGTTANVVVFGLAHTSALCTIRPLGNYFGCDWVTVTELALLGDIFEIQDVLSFYRRHAQSSSTYKKSPSATSQQAFYDPSVKGRLKQEFQLRRRYFEMLHAIVRANLGLGQRILIALAMILSIIWKVIWRVGFELRLLLGRLDNSQTTSTKKIGLHWSNYS